MKGGAERALDTASTDSRRPRHLQYHPASRLEAVGCPASDCPECGQPLPGPAGRPLAPARGSEAPPLVFRSAPREPSSSLQSFKPEDVNNS